MDVNLIEFHIKTICRSTTLSIKEVFFVCYTFDLCSLFCIFCEGLFSAELETNKCFYLMPRHTSGNGQLFLNN